MSTSWEGPNSSILTRPIEDGPCEDTGVRTFHVTFGSNTS